jgi:hypothetical protein
LLILWNRPGTIAEVASEFWNRVGTIADVISEFCDRPGSYGNAISELCGGLEILPERFQSSAMVPELLPAGFKN